MERRPNRGQVISLCASDRCTDAFCWEPAPALWRIPADSPGKDINVLSSLTAKGVKLFDHAYCWMYFRVFAMGQKMSWSERNSLDHIFERRVIKEDGSPDEEYLFSHKTVARWDFNICTSILASQTNITPKRDIFLQAGSHKRQVGLVSYPGGTSANLSGPQQRMMKRRSGNAVFQQAGRGPSSCRCSCPEPECWVGSVLDRQMCSRRWGGDTYTRARVHVHVQSHTGTGKSMSARTWRQAVLVPWPSCAPEAGDLCCLYVASDIVAGASAAADDIVALDIVLYRRRRHCSTLRNCARPRLVLQ